MLTSGNERLHAGGEEGAARAGAGNVVHETVNTFLYAPQPTLSPARMTRNGFTWNFDGRSMVKRLHGQEKYYSPS